MYGAQVGNDDQGLVMRRRMLTKCQGGKRQDNKYSVDLHESDNKSWPCVRVITLVSITPDAQSGRVVK